ncbi:MAG TPA: sulfotransferase [Phycisphaerales bacterium]|nr:sulfotransferase [Phycisphaerales bacterium]
MDRLDFCIVGAMKAATTTLASLLAAHPGVVMAEPKEPGYFSRDERYARGLEWYRAHFRDADGVLVGEASTCYSRRVPFPHAASRLAAFSPGVKLIYILRHPADRAIAHYVHEMRLRFRDGKPVIGFDECCGADPAVLSASEYEKEIDHLLASFPRDQLLLLRFEDLIGEQGRVFGEVQSWLGLERVDTEAAWENRAMDKARSHEVDRRVEGVTKNPAVRALRAVLPASVRSAGRRRLKRLLAKTGGVEREIEAFEASLDRPTGDRRRVLVERYAPTVAAVGAMTGWDLSDWRQ